MYERPFDHRNDYVSTWAPRDPPTYSERRDHQYVDSRHPEFQHSRDPMMYGQSTYNAPLPAPVTYLPQPSTGYMPSRRPEMYGSPPTRFRHADVRGYASEGMHTSRHPQEPHRGPYAYSIAQESRHASHNERKNGRDWEGEQFQPPPPPHLAESTSYSSGMRYQG